MPDYRRYFVPGGTYFFTLFTYRRRRFLTTERARRCLRLAIAEVRQRRPFATHAMVPLPDHLYVLWSLPPQDDDHSTRWRRIKERFTKRYLAEGGTDFSDLADSAREKR